MSRLLSAELLKLRSARTLPLPLLASLALVLFVSYQQIQRAGVSGAPSLGTFTHAHQLLGAPGMVAILLLLFGVLAATADLRHHTVIGDFLATPRRWPVVAAKAIAVLLVAAAWSLFTSAAQLAMVVPWLRAEGVDLFAMMTGELWVHAVASVATGPLMALLGVGLGTVLRNQALAAGGGVLWFAFLEHELSGAVPALGQWLPATASLAMTGISHGAQLSVGGAAALLSAWALALTGAAALLTVRRDV